MVNSNKENISFGIGLKMQTDSVNESEWAVDGPPAKTRTIPDPADILIGYSTTPGSQAVRDKNKGSLYITTLVGMIAKHAQRYHLVQYLRFWLLIKLLLKEVLSKVICSILYQRRLSLHVVNLLYVVFNNLFIWSPSISTSLARK